MIVVVIILRNIINQAAVKYFTQHAVDQICVHIYRNPLMWLLLLTNYYNTRLACFGRPEVFYQAEEDFRFIGFTFYIQPM